MTATIEKRLGDHETRIKGVEKGQRQLWGAMKETRLLTRALVARQGMDPDKVGNGEKDSLRLILTGESVKWFIRIVGILMGGGILGKMNGWF